MLIVPGMIFATVSQRDLLCRSFGRCLAGDPMDGLGLPDVEPGQVAKLDSVKHAGLEPVGTAPARTPVDRTQFAGLL